MSRSFQSFQQEMAFEESFEAVSRWFHVISGKLHGLGDSRKFEVCFKVFEGSFVL